MNNSTYIFGKLGHGYVQYPFDSLKELFEQCANLSQDDKQIVVRRQGNLMYYIYINYLNKHHTVYIGLCLVFSELKITDFKSLFNLFEEGVRSLAIDGEILTYKDNEIVSNSSYLCDKAAVVQSLDDYLSVKLANLQDTMQSLQAVNYSVSSQTVKKCNLFINKDNILRYADTYGFTVISPGEVEEEESELQSFLNPKNSKSTSFNFLNKIINKIKSICK